MKTRILLLISLLLGHTMYLNAADTQWQGRIQGEFGLQQTQGQNILVSPGMLGRFLVQLGIKGRIKLSRWGAHMRFRPELWTGETTATNLKYLWSGYWQQQYRTWTWQLQISGKYYSYQNQTPKNVSFSIFQIAGFWQHYYRKNLFFSLEGHLLYRDLTYIYDSNLDAHIAQIGGNYLLRPHLSLGLKWYFESFRISSRDYFLTEMERRENTGWRSGPEITLEHQSKILFTLTYRFLTHQSRLTKSGAREQWVRLVTSWSWNRRWYVFGLVDYYFLTTPGTSTEQAPLLYSPLDNENRIFLKIARSISYRSDLFLKGGYLQETLLKELFTLSGWQLTAGIEWQF